MKPIIGLTAYSPDERPGWLVPDLYIEAIANSGGVPVVLPGSDPSFIQEWLKIVHGVVFIGGGDISPHLYGKQAGEHLYGLSERRDAKELALMKQLLQTSIPVFAICRGMQVLNVALGGTLYTHLPDVYGEALPHRSTQGEGGPSRHSIQIQADSRLAAMVGEQDNIISYHHQCIDQLGEGLRVVARADDGVIEAVELEGRENIIAVQWHPEMGYAELATQRTLFQYFMDDVKAYQMQAASDSEVVK